MPHGLGMTGPPPGTIEIAPAVTPVWLHKARGGVRVFSSDSTLGRLLMKEQNVNKETEPCGYKYCRSRGVFIRRHPHQRFCSPACKYAYAYDLKRSGARKRRLSPDVATPLPDFVESEAFYPIETVVCKPPKPSVFSVPTEILGKGHKWPGAKSINRRLWAAIVECEV
jgi:hypothetical protein